MKVIFSHGKESGPWGTKITYLAEIAREHGFTIDSIDYQGIADPDVRVKKLVDAIANETQEYILVGSSMGAYVSIVAASELNAKGVFLMAPAVYMPGYESSAYAHDQENLLIVHGWNDEIIPWKNSLRFAEKSQCDLHMLNSDHRLVDSLNKVGKIFDVFLSLVK